METREEERAWKHTYGHTAAWRVCGWSCFFLLDLLYVPRGWVGCVRFFPWSSICRGRARRFSVLHRVGWLAFVGLRSCVMVMSLYEDVKQRERGRERKHTLTFAWRVCGRVCARCSVSRSRFVR